MSETGINRRQAVTTVTASAIAMAILRMNTAAGPAAADTGGDVGGPDGPVRITFLFGQPDDQSVFEQHYQSVHLPLVVGVPGLVHMESCMGTGSLDGTSSAFYRANTLTFQSRRDMILAAQSEIGAAALADLDVFATGGVTATIVANIDDYEPQPPPVADTDSRFRNGVDPRTP
ncbi:MAG: EthD family reductase [Thermomicrobiales bacterium]|nr:EthD family reductase [Thermomicrobiales bacterium]MCO5217518.1 EthD family reductase [Thermomicrobiales bacterium]MCO5223999.1 EthD family reductase [Thermomicrobiales bacterium]MCO5226813.1 EthD family reductase [Thermomicrobiales bacterium]